MKYISLEDLLDEMIEELSIHKTPIAGALAEGAIMTLQELKERLLSKK